MSGENPEGEGEGVFTTLNAECQLNPASFQTIRRLSHEHPPQGIREGPRKLNNYQRPAVEWKLLLVMVLRTAITNRELGGLNNRRVPSYSSGGWKPEIELSAGSAPLRVNGSLLSEITALLSQPNSSG